MNSAPDRKVLVVPVPTARSGPREERDDGVGDSGSDAAVDSGWPAFHSPDTREPLELDGDMWVSPSGVRYPVVRGIPRFVSSSSYADAFGLQWRRYRLVQLDSHTGGTESHDRARRCMGEALWRELEGRHVLEAGCGAGRFTEVLLARGAFVTSVDLSDAVEANQENYPQGARHRIGQADISRLPFAPRQFDHVFCLGVIQHTPDPEATVAALYEMVKPGGGLVIDHYRYELSWFTKTAPLLRRFVFRHLSPERGLRWTEALVRTLWPLHRLVRRFYFAQMLLSRVSPVASYYHGRPWLDDRQQFEWALLDTHDTLTCHYRHYRTCGQIRGLLERMGLQDVSVEYAGNGVEARGRRARAS